MAQHDRFADAGTPGRLSPELGRQSGITPKKGLFNTIMQGVAGGVRANLPAADNFYSGIEERDIKQQQININRDEEERLLKDQDEKLRAEAETIVLSEQFKFIHPEQEKALKNILSLKGLDSSPSGRVNKQQFIELLGKGDPEDYHKVIQLGTEKWDEDIALLKPQIKDKAEKVAEKMGVTADRIMSLDSQKLQSIDKNLAVLVKMKEHAQNALNENSRLSMLLAKEEKQFSPSDLEANEVLRIAREKNIPIAEAMKIFEEISKPEQKIDRIMLALRASNIPANTTIENLTQKQARDTLEILKEFSSGFFDISEIFAPENHKKTLFDWLLGAKKSPEDQGGSPEDQEFSPEDQEMLNNLLGQ